MVIKNEGSTSYIGNEKNGKTISLKGYTLYGAQLTFFCTKEFYGQIQAHDFQSYFIRDGLSEKDIMYLIHEKIGNVKERVTLEEVYTSMFSNDFKLGKLDENKYEVRYYQLIK